MVVYPVLLASSAYVVVELTDSIIKLLVWALPAVMAIRRYRGDIRIGAREMLITKPKWGKSVIALLLEVLILLLEALILHGEIKVRPDFIPATLIGGVAFVGITEEVLFRGFLLNAMLKKLKLWPAVMINAALFALIHCPGYISQGLDLPTIFVSSITALIPISIFFAFSFIKTRNILIPIVFHMTWNLLSMLFVI